MSDSPIPAAMADPRARAARRRSLNLAPSSPLTHLVDELRAERGPAVPYVDPLSGGTEASVLFVLKRPGEKAVESGFLSLENHDRTARNFLALMAEAGIPYSEITFWNIIPWYGPRKARLSSAELSEGMAWLNRLLTLLPRLRALVLVGRDAQAAAGRVKLPPSAGLFLCPHPSPSNLNTDKPQRLVILRVLREVRAGITDAPCA
jgi:uracil-DNA glycosylase